MQPRSWLFVPADSEKKINRALDSEADAIIFDLEDSVAPAMKKVARDLLRNLLKRSGGPEWWVRINPLASEFIRDDLKLLGVADIHGIVLPKTENGTDITQLAHRTGNIPIHAIVTETAASLFGLLSYRDPKSPLAAMSWGAEDLSAALGAASKYDESGELSFTYRLARSLCLAGAVAAGVQAVDGVFANFRDETDCAQKRRRRGAKASPASSLFTPRRCLINAAFTPSDEEVRQAEEIVAAFEAQPDAGVLSIGGKMVDRPHLVQARRVLERAARSS